MNNPNMRLSNDATEANAEAFLRSAKLTFLIFGVFSGINVLALTTGISSSFFFFSAWTPYFLTDYTMAYCLKFPKENYGDAYEKYFENQLPESTFIIAVIISALIAIAYIALWWFSGRSKPKLSLILGLGLTVADTCILIASLYIIPLNSTVVMCFVFHAVVIFQQIMGIRSLSKTKNTQIGNK